MLCVRRCQDVSVKFVAGGPSKRSGPGRRPLFSWVVGDEIRRSALEAELETSAQRLSARTSFLSPPSSPNLLCASFFFCNGCGTYGREEHEPLLRHAESTPRGGALSISAEVVPGQRGSASYRRKLGARISATWTSHPSAGSNAQDRVWPARAQRRTPGPHVHPLSFHSAPGSVF